MCKECFVKFCVSVWYRHITFFIYICNIASGKGGVIVYMKIMMVFSENIGRQEIALIWHDYVWKPYFGIFWRYYFITNLVFVSGRGWEWSKYRLHKSKGGKILICHGYIYMLCWLILKLLNIRVYYDTNFDIFTKSYVFSRWKHTPQYYISLCHKLKYFRVCYIIGYSPDHFPPSWRKFSRPWVERKKERYFCRCTKHACNKSALWCHTIGKYA